MRINKKNIIICMDECTSEINYLFKKKKKKKKKTKGQPQEEAKPKRGNLKKRPNPKGATSRRGQTQKGQPQEEAKPQRGNLKKRPNPKGATSRRGQTRKGQPQKEAEAKRGNLKKRPNPKGATSINNIKVDVQFPYILSVETAYSSLRNCGWNKKEAVQEVSSRYMQN